MTIHTEERAEFEGDTGMIVGTAEYSYDMDGGEVTNIELLRVRVDALVLSRDQIIAVTSKSAVERCESLRLEEIERLYDPIGDAADRAYEMGWAAE